MQIKVNVGKYKIPIDLEFQGDRIFCAFRYNKALLAEIKDMDGAKWHGFDPKPRKIWSIANSPRNIFQLARLQGLNPYKHYDQPLVPAKSKRPLMRHQYIMKSHILTRKRCAIFGEMGTGKTLPAIEAIEDSGITDWWWISTRGGLVSTSIELQVWNAKVHPTLMTYDALRSRADAWKEGYPYPKGIVFDESSKVKSPTAQRSQAAMFFADKVREHDGYIVLLTGTPAPKNPGDFWYQCEIACPGFLKEGSLPRFKAKLSVVVMKESIAGGSYPELVTWLDDEKKCAVCGKYLEEGPHTDMDIMMNGGHEFKPSVNEIERLYKRMNGLVLIYFKRDCMDLPEKRYRVIRVTPTEETLRVLKTLKETSARVIEALTLARELSDGFQYQDEVSGEKACENCLGTGKKEEYFDPLNPDDIPDPTAKLEKRLAECVNCSGTGKVPTYKRVAKMVPSPKEQVVKDILEEHEEVGRLVIYAAFEGSIDKCVNIALSEGWQVIRVDSRGWWYSQCELSSKDMILTFQKQLGNEEKIVFIGQPGAAGIGLTLTASPSILYYSNDFNAENRIQSEDRIHRKGMDENRGATIIDIVHLPTDELILSNLKKKRDLQSLSLQEFKNDGTRLNDN